MTHIGTLDALQLSLILKRFEAQQQTGRLLISTNDKHTEMYIYQGNVVAIVTDQPRTSLIRRLLQAKMISMQQLHTMSTSVRKAISQEGIDKPYSDKQVAFELVQLSIIDRERLEQWIRKETSQELKLLLVNTHGKVDFEEDITPPDDLLYVLPEEDMYFIPAKSAQSQVKKESEDTATIGISARQIAASAPTVANPVLRTSLLADIDSIPVDKGSFTLDDVRTEVVPIPRIANPLLKWEVLLVLVILLIAGLAHGINMFHYPYYEDDEGTYLSQAWAVVHLGRLAYYTYWYDHAPAGWIQLAGWLALTGGFRTFGSAMNSGRVFMLVLQLGSTFVLYRIARIISKSWAIATIVTLLFALSPYGLYYHRRILLDNIMTFWMLLSILFLLAKQVSLKNVWLSAISLAVSILSKEVAAFVIPALAYFVWIRTDRSHRAIAFTSWVILIIAILSIYPLMAILKGELFPTGTFLGGSNPHVSLIGSVSYQGSRGSDAGLFSLHSFFWSNLIPWIQSDPLLVIGGSLSAFILLFFTKKQPLIAIPGLVTLSLWAFLARGGVLLGFYLIPLIPLMALNIGLILGMLVQPVKKCLISFLKTKGSFNHLIQPTLALFCIIILLLVVPPPSTGTGYGAPNLGDKQDPLIYWNGAQADDQVAAINWVEQHLSTNSRIIIDMYMWPELHTHGYKYVHYYWKLDEDPAIRNGVFHNNWKNIDYIITTPQMLSDMKATDMTILEEPISHSKVIAQFNKGSWPVYILEVKK